MKKVIISPFSQIMRNGKNNPKNFPYWKEVIKNLQKNNIHVIQIGLTGEELLGANENKFNLRLKDLKILLENSTTWASVDNFFNHFAALTQKPGVVIFGKSDPIIFGYNCNINLLKSRENLRKNQFDIWESETFQENVFVSADEVTNAILKLCN